MQKIRYVNPHGKEVILEKGPPFVLEKVTGTGAEDATLLTSEPAFVDGKYFHGLYMGDREITASVHIYGKDRKALYENRQKLMALLSPGQFKEGKMGILEYQNDYIKVWIPAIVKKGPQPVNRQGLYHTSVQIVFYCPDSDWRGMSQQAARIAYVDGGMEFPLEIDHESGVRFGARGYAGSIYNFGDKPTPVEVTITGPAVNPEVRKVATGEYIRVKRELFAGDVLSIQTDPQQMQVTITRASGSVEKAMGYLDATSTFLQLEPGENKLQYFSEDDSTASEIIVRAYDRYGGV
ncbi:MAG: phage tail family protein [Clostridiales bacterium]|nr:phage tail family protein [Clostridiales bacterium]